MNYKTSIECKACQKKFTNTGLLNNHLNKTILCKKWIEILKCPVEKQEFDEKIVSRIQSIYDGSKKIPIINSELLCLSCHKEFSNVGNLNKHIKRNIICSKWDRYHKLQEREDYNLDTDIYNINSTMSPFVKLPNIPMHHIIWNLYLTDKESKIDDYSKYNIDLVICIMPSYSYDKWKNCKEGTNVEFINLEYTDHSPVLKNSEIKGYKNMAEKLIILQKDRKNALIICNNGYQRSLPFISYYLTNYHKDEVPDVSKALDIILYQLDPKNYNKTKPKYTELITDLLQRSHLK